VRKGKRERGCMWLARHEG